MDGERLSPAGCRPQGCLPDSFSWVHLAYERGGTMALAIDQDHFNTKGSNVLVVFFLSFFLSVSSSVIFIFSRQSLELLVLMDEPQQRFQHFYVPLVLPL